MLVSTQVLASSYRCCSWSSRRWCGHASAKSCDERIWLGARALTGLAAVVRGATHGDIPWDMSWILFFVDKLSSFRATYFHSPAALNRPSRGPGLTLRCLAIRLPQCSGFVVHVLLLGVTYGWARNTIRQRAHAARRSMEVQHGAACRR